MTNPLRTIREEAGVSQRQMALRLRLSNTALVKWERASAATPERIAAYRAAIEEGAR
jgi:transcriptional regulator with XRE-family HTH domain